MTTPNPHLMHRLAGIRDSLMAHHRGGRGLPNATIGNERETFLREFLGKVFPAPYRFSGGVVTDAAGGLSGQIDIAVEWPFLPSFPMPNAADRLLLAESVAAVIEVKSDLSGQWDQVEKTTRAVKMLRRHWRGSVHHIGGRLGVSSGGYSPIPVIAVGYCGHRTADGLRDRLLAAAPDARPDAAFVIESECFVFPEIAGQGPGGLYALCVLIRNLTAAVASADGYLLSYLGFSQNVPEPGWSWR